MFIIIFVLSTIGIVALFHITNKQSIASGRNLEHIDMCVWARDKDDATAQVILNYLQDSERKEKS